MTGESNVELTAQGLAVDVAETGEIRLIDSGGEVVLRWMPGLEDWDCV